MKKVITYLRYLIDYMKYADIISIISSINYILFKKTHKADRLVQTSIGIFNCRGGTNDFQFANYYYEWGVKKFILDRIADYDVFIDGGACIGEYSILLAKKGLRCYAFEPVQSSFDALSDNIKLNKLEKQVTIFQYGLGEANEKVGLVYNPVNTGASHIARVEEKPDLQVEIKTFDSILESLDIMKDERILFKLDVEGMEPETIKGASQFITDFPNITFILEDKHSGEDSIKSAFGETAPFSFGIVDEYNIYATKT